MKGYLRCVASVDDNIGRLLAYLDRAGLADNTLVVYTSDHGFFLGDHGFYDKRFMYEESIRIPLLVRGPGVAATGVADDRMVLNVDFAPTLLDLAGAPVPADMPGRSLRPLLAGEVVGDWRTSMYYRYWMHGAHFDVAAHYGVRTETPQAHLLLRRPARRGRGGGRSDARRSGSCSTWCATRRNWSTCTTTPPMPPCAPSSRPELQRLRTEVGDSA